LSSPIEVEFKRSKEERCAIASASDIGGSRVQQPEQRVNEEAVFGLSPLSHWSDELSHAGDRGGAEAENRSQRRPGFIDRVFDLVQSVLQKHQLLGQMDGCSDCSGD
jgi:hypothetical protein